MNANALRSRTASIALIMVMTSLAAFVAAVLLLLLHG